MVEKINGNRVTPQLDFKEIISLNIGFMQAFGVFVPEFRSALARGLFVAHAVSFLGTYMCQI